jgi:hypothetical protein
VGGEYFFYHVPAGSYRARALVPGSAETTESELFALSDGQDSKHVLVAGGQPRVAVATYPEAVSAGTTIPVAITWSHLPSDTDYRLVLRLENTMSGNAVAGSATIDRFVADGAATCSLMVDRAASIGSRYRFALYCISRTAGESDIAASAFTDNTVRVANDTMPPVITVPANLVLEATSVHGATTTLTATAVDDNDLSPLITDNAPAIFPLGRTVVTFVAMDATGNTASSTMTVTVVDRTPPVIAEPEPVIAEASAVHTQVALTPPAVQTSSRLRLLITHRQRLRWV